MLFAKPLIAAIDRRLRKMRAGSVLIIVIVLLLLLAILGAAYISTTRSARVASAQNVLNSDVDTVLSGIAKVCEGTIVDDLNDTFGNLHGNTAYTTNTITNRSFYQGQAGVSPTIQPNVPWVAGPPAGYTYNPGDIASDVTNKSMFYSLAGSASVTLTSNITPSVSPASGWQVMDGRLPITALGSDPYLADRVPDSTDTGVALWQYLTQSIQVNASYPGGAPASIIGTDFEDPTYTARNSVATTNVITLSLAKPLVGGTTGSPKPIYPTYLTLANGLNVPALTNTSPPSNGPANTFVAGDADGDGVADSFLFRVPGVDLDGLTWYAAVRIIDNNSAINANTAWSRDTESFFPPNTGANTANTWALFQTSVGLQELINTADVPGYSVTHTLSLNALNPYRFNDNTTTVGPPPVPTPNAGQDPYDESAIGYNATTYGYSTHANIPPQGFGRGTVNATDSQDYNFISQSEAFHQQLIRRIGNPGYNNYASGARYQALPLSDEAALAYHFCLRNPASSNPQSVLESLLPNSLWNTAPSTAYDPSFTFNPSLPTDPTTWYGANFAYLSGNSTVPIRSLLVTHNPVSNYIQQIYNTTGGTPSTSDPILRNYMLPYSGPSSPHFKGTWSDTVTYNQNDIVVFPGPNPDSTAAATGNYFNAPGGIYSGPSYTFIASASTTGQPPAILTNGTTNSSPANSYNVLKAVNSPWQLQPWSVNPTKANVNTATFRELFRAFWCAMAGNPSNATPFGVTGVDGYNIYDPTAPTAASPGTGNPQAMFRSPLRDPVGANTQYVSLLDVPVTVGAATTVTNTNVMLLRAALAAVNTLGLRDNSQNVVSRTVTLQNPSQIDTLSSSTAQSPVELQVFSDAPNPVISEVYANTDATDPQNGNKPYVAVELYNPYTVPLTLVNWQLGLINRTTAASVNFTKVYPNLRLQTNPTNDAAPLPYPASVSVIGSTTGQAAQAINTPSTQPSVTTASGTAPPVGVIVIPPHGYALLENYNYNNPGANTGDATARPAGMAGAGGAGSIPTAGPWYGPGGQTDCNTCDVYVQNLQLVIKGAVGSSISGTSTGGELVLLRPRQANGQYTSSADPQNAFAEVNTIGGAPTLAGSTTYPMLYSQVYPNLYDMVPVDSYDFSGLTAGGGFAWSYVRQKQGQTVASIPLPSGTPPVWFKALFPGFYNTAAPQRQSGTNFAPVAGGVQTGAFAMPPVFGQDQTAGPYSSFPHSNAFPPIQIYNVNLLSNGSMHFPNSISVPAYPLGASVAAPYSHPLGGFARNGDMLDIPFIGAYRIRITTGAYAQLGTQYFLEMNSLPMDCSLAAIDTGSDEENVVENIGRFVPMAASAGYYTAIQIQPAKFPDGTAATLPLPDYYSWTRNIFNYLTVQSSTDAYLPNFDPNLSSTSTTPTFAYPAQNATPPVPPTPALTADAAATDQTKQDNVGVEGLININTASWKVLSMLPMVTANEDSANWIKDNESLAKAIVVWRITHGPFTSIYDLNSVIDNSIASPGTASKPPGFQNAEGYLAVANGGVPTGTPAVEVSSANGIISPPDPAFPKVTPYYSGVPEDYQSDCAILTRISNLITTRSDTFTVYIEVQGWQNVGMKDASGNSLAQPMITRRYAFIVDRSAINGDPNSRFLKTVTVPND